MTTQEHDDRARALIAAALESGAISRSDFNIARRTGALMSAETVALWKSLNDAIGNRSVRIREDGDGVFDDRGIRIG